MIQNNYPEGLDELAGEVTQRMGWALDPVEKDDMALFARDLLDALAERGYVLVDAKKQEPVAWQPIETAPKDGTEIIVMDGVGGIHGAKWYSYRGKTDWFHHTNLGWIPSANRWMPLPAAPDAAMEASNG